MATAAPVSSSFCVPHETQMVIKHGSWRRKSGWTIKDEQGILLFNVKTKDGPFSYVSRPFLFYDATSEKLLLSIRREQKSFARSKWITFKGDSESESELLFTLRHDSSSRASYEVFLAENNDSSIPDFYIKMQRKSWWSRSSLSVLSNGRVIAEGKPIGRMSSEYTVTVYPEVDRAFIAALVQIWILECMQQQSNSAAGAAAAGAAAAGAAAAGGGGGGA